MPQRRLGHFRPGHNGFGFKGEIAISRQHVLDNLLPTQWWKVLGTLLHELLHAWQQIHGKPGKHNYHNVAFREKARELGLIIDQKGVTEFEQPSRFFALLEEHGIKVPKIDLPSPPLKRPGKSKLRLWMCGCPVRARVGRRRFNVQCLDCNQQLELQQEV